MADLPSSEILELIRGQARLETKIDQFFSAQTSMKAEIDVLKTDITAVKADVSEIKTQRRGTGGWIAGVIASAGGISWLAGLIASPFVKKFLGI